MAKYKRIKKGKNSKSVQVIEVKKPYNWIDKLNETKKLNAAPVELFKCLNIDDSWKRLFKYTIKIEIQNNDAVKIDGKNAKDCYWVATVIEKRGFFLLLRFEGYEKESEDDFWLHIYDDRIKPCGWAHKNKKCLLPPKNLFKNVEKDWKSYLSRSLMNAYTLPDNYREQIELCVKSHFKIGLKLEAIDLKKVCAVRVATIVNVIGPRLQVAYDPKKELNNSNSFWCHQQSSLIHPVGWAELVGHQLDCSQEYSNKTRTKLETGNWESDDADFKYFPHIYRSMKELTNKAPNNNSQTFMKNMRVEAIDALHMNHIRLSTVFKTLRYDYLLIGVDGEMVEDGSDSWCCHKSECLPIGFCEKNNIDFIIPKDYKTRNFDIEKYLKDKNAVAAPDDLFEDDIYDEKHGFKTGMYLEATDLMEPNLICPARVKQVAGKLLKIGFMGWSDDYDQWVDCNSCEIYPIGWCSIAGYHLETPSRQIKSGKDYTPEDESSSEIRSVRNAPKKTRNSNKRSYKKQKTSKRTSNISKYNDQSDTSSESLDLESVSSESSIKRGRLKIKNTRKNSNKTVQNSNTKNSGDKSKSKKPNTRSSSNQTIRTRSQSTNRKNIPIEINTDNENDDVIIEENNKPAKTDDCTVMSNKDIERIDLYSAQLESDEVMFDQNNNNYSNKKDDDHNVDLNIEGLNVGDNEEVDDHNVDLNIEGLNVDDNEEDNEDQDSDDGIERNPYNWSVNQVKDFLSLNGCDKIICDAFFEHQVTGEILMNLTSDRIFEIVNNITGNALKVTNLINELRRSINNETGQNDSDSE